MDENPYKSKHSDVVLVLAFLLGCILVAALIWR
jgi:hypothetical protein